MKLEATLWTVNFKGITFILPVSLVGLIAIGSANSDWPDFVTQATYHGKSNEKQKNNYKDKQKCLEDT